MDFPKMKGNWKKTAQYELSSKNSLFQSSGEDYSHIQGKKEEKTLDCHASKIPINHLLSVDLLHAGSSCGAFIVQTDWQNSLYHVIQNEGPVISDGRRKKQKSHTHSHIANYFSFIHLWSMLIILGYVTRVIVSLSLWIVAALVRLHFGQHRW